ncbi:MAG: AMP-binding protein [Candidatus Obscuribacterales bacterium]|nr:AMP-binding protein [Candidatus Obscuribacterales bacterium]
MADIIADSKLSYEHGACDEPLLGHTLGAWLDKVVCENAQGEALVSPKQDLRFTFKQLKVQVDLFARGLMKLGIAKGDRVGIWSTNCAEWVICQFALAKVGAILVNINPAYRKEELQYVLKQSQMKLLICRPGFKDHEYLEMVKALKPSLLGAGQDSEKADDILPLEQVVVICSTKKIEGPALGFEEVLKIGEDLPQAELEARSESLQFDDAVNIQYTSGTTGFPKGVTLSHHNLLNNAWFAGRALELNNKTRYCVAMPFYHCGGMVTGTIMTLIRGGCVVVPNPHFDPEATLTAVAAERCTHLCGVPTMYIDQLEHPQFTQFDLTSLVGGFMAGAPCPVKLMEEVADKMHMTKVVIFYGLTEASPLITVTSATDSLEVRTTTVGSVLPHVECKVVDAETGALLPRGQQGEVCTRGYNVMLGYWHNKQATDDAIDAGRWLHTGDLGVLNEAGHLNITGRKKDMIIRGGENIYPREIEEVLHVHEKIAQAQIFGVPDKHFGEEVCAWIQLKEGVVAEGNEIKTWLKTRVAHFKVPRYVKFVSSYPKTVTGKIQKFVMRDQMIAELKLESAASVTTA